MSHNLEDIVTMINEGASVIAYVDNDNISFYTVSEDGEDAYELEPLTEMHPYDYIRESMEILAIDYEAV